MEPKATNGKDEAINHSNIYFYLIYSDVKKAFHKIMQHKDIWFIL